MAMQILETGIRLELETIQDRHWNLVRWVYKPGSDRRRCREIVSETLD